ncbi:mucin-2-like [Ornithodoros turicata]|uniref:mucin-2-like n=1 Tax=Ornithodoros turicata TaxID=34597 RepID=UPI003138B349
MLSSGAGGEGEEEGSESGTEGDNSVVYDQSGAPSTPSRTTSTTSTTTSTTSTTTSTTSTTTSTTSTTTSTTTTTTTTKTPLDPQLMVCTSSSVTSTVPDGLCHFYMYRPSYAPFKISTLKFEFSTTRFGIDIEQEVRSDAMKQLDTPSGMTSIRDLYRNGTLHFSVLDFDITTKTSNAEVDQLIKFLKTISKVQFDEREGRNFGYLFVGVSPIGSDSGNTIRDHVQRIIEEARPDGILFLTTYVRLKSQGSECFIAAPSVWTVPTGTAPRQPTFVTSLDLRRTLQIPKTTIQLLSLTPHTRGTYMTLDIYHPPSFDSNTACNVSLSEDMHQYSEVIDHAVHDVEASANEGKFCIYGEYHDDYLKTTGRDICDHVRLSRGVAYNKKWYEGYDDVKLMKLKMCKAYREYGYQGGWVMFDIYRDDVKKICFEPNGTYGFTSAVKKYMYERRSSCESVDSACKREEPYHI